MDESTQLTLRALLALLKELLTQVHLVLVRMVEALEGRVRENAFVRAALARLLVVLLALFGHVEVLVRRTSEVERLVRIDAMVPVVVSHAVPAKLRFVPIQVKEGRLNRLQIVL